MLLAHLSRPMEAELEETEALKEKRDARAEKESKLQSELSSIKKTYYCDVCDKTYNSGAELEVHLSSYDHGHKKRFRDMKMMQVSWPVCLFYFFVLEWGGGREEKVLMKA